MNNQLNEKKLKNFFSEKLEKIRKMFSRIGGTTN
jgi:hypothetical protein